MVVSIVDSLVELGIITDVRVVGIALVIAVVTVVVIVVEGTDDVVDIGMLVVLVVLVVLLGSDDVCGGGGVFVGGGVGVNVVLLGFASVLQRTSRIWPSLTSTIREFEAALMLVHSPCTENCTASNPAIQPSEHVAPPVKSLRLHPRIGRL